MFSFLRKKALGKGTALAFLVLVLLAGSLLVSCDTEEKSDPDHKALIGEWHDEYGSIITITGSSFMYGDGWGGKIAYFKYFNNEKNKGIIIIKYSAGLEKVWSSWVEESPGNWVETLIDPQPEGKYYGIYFDHLGLGADLGYAIRTGMGVHLNQTSDQNDFGPSETLTLNEAILRFTEADQDQWMNMGFFSEDGFFLKQ